MTGSGRQTTFAAIPVVDFILCPHMYEHEKTWNPLSISEVSQLFVNAQFEWWIAGGIALELAVGHVIRKHSDIDILVLRRDQLALRELLSDWDCWVADPPGELRKWRKDEELENFVHDIWCRKAENDDWRIQVMLDETDGRNWISRRCNQIRAPINEITRVSSTGVTFAAPHIQLYYKAKNIREKDEIDFEAVIRSGTSIDRDWLRRSIACCYGHQHPWLKRLS